MFILIGYNPIGLQEKNVIHYPIILKHNTAVSGLKRVSLNFIKTKCFLSSHKLHRIIDIGVDRMIRWASDKNVIRTLWQMSAPFPHMYEWVTFVSWHSKQACCYFDLIMVKQLTFVTMYLMVFNRTPQY